MRVVLLVAGLMGAAPPEGVPAGKATAEAEAAAPRPEGEALAKYNEMRAKAANTAAAQWKLAVWCEQNGLAAEAYAHLTAVVRLDPGRDAAWRKLGYKKVRGRWVSPEEAAGEAQVLQSVREWGPRLKKIHHDVHARNGRDAALEAIAAIDDPNAIPAVYREFGTGGPIDQMIAVQILGRIQAPLSSRVLALLSVYGKSSEVRRAATETLCRRDPEDFLSVLVDLLTDPLKYEVKPVGGPGSPGVLFVEGERYNLRRFYPAPTPFVAFRPGDIIGYDENGLPSITRSMGTLTSQLVSQTGRAKTGITRTYRDTNLETRYSMTELITEAQKAAVSSQMALQADIAAIDTLNEAKARFNELVMAVARAATGKDPGNTPKDWRETAAGRAAYRAGPAASPPKQTVDEVAPTYLPQISGSLAFARVTRVSTTPPDN